MMEGMDKTKGGYVTMMRSMFSGVSGLRAHQTKMDVIGNNIANVNTVAFKSGRVTFQEIFSQTTRGAAAPDSSNGRGGTNPMQVGLGASVGVIDIVHTRGSFQRTDNLLDLMIEGEGFFVVKGSNSDPYMFTRAGNFGYDKLGNIVTADGLRVYGWQDRDGDSFDSQKPLEPLNIYQDSHNGNKRILAAKETTYSQFTGNLDATAKLVDTPLAGSGVTYGEVKDLSSYKVPFTVYDRLGNDYTLTLNFVKNEIKDGPETEWFWYAVDENAVIPDDEVPAQGLVTFDDKGKFVSSTVEAITVQLPAESGTTDFTFDVDFSTLTQFKSNGSVKSTDVDGYPPGEFVTFSIGSNGILTGVYSNGQQQTLGMVALAHFENPAGLEKTGNNMFIPTANSGDFRQGVKPGTEGTGILNPGGLEMSNVDLSKEFTEMIITQRGFQANSRIITTSDEMLQELVNLKR